MVPGQLHGYIYGNMIAIQFQTVTVYNPIDVVIYRTPVVHRWHYKTIFPIQREFSR